jgi:DNA-binding CsgD family transcriptional regulator
MTQRQREVVRLMTAGQRPKEIARALGISPWTVATHVRNAKARTEIRDTLRLVAVSALEFDRQDT